VTPDAEQARIALVCVRYFLRHSTAALNGAEPPEAVRDTITGLTARLADSGNAEPLRTNGSGPPVDSPTITVAPSGVDVATAALRRGISERTVRHQAQTGALRARKVGARTWLIEDGEEVCSGD